MGRADIAILSEISFGIRLCLHPPCTYLREEGLAYDDWSHSCYARLDFCRDTSDVPRRERQLQAISSRTFLRAQSLRGHMGRSFLPVIDKPQPAPHRPALWQDGSLHGCARLQASARSLHPGADTAAGRCSIILVIIHPSEEVPFVERTIWLFFVFSVPSLVGC